MGNKRSKHNFKIKPIFKSLLAWDWEEFVCLLHQSESKQGASGTLKLGGFFWGGVWFANLGAIFRVSSLKFHGKGETVHSTQNK